jgi:hypothetical protein
MIGLRIVFGSRIELLGSRIADRGLRTAGRERRFHVCKQNESAGRRGNRRTGDDGRDPQSAIRNPNTIRDPRSE